jgi:uncharacterized protein YjiK/methionine-rich copper-binding protein CopC
MPTLAGCLDLEKQRTAMRLPRTSLSLTLVASAVALTLGACGGGDTPELSFTDPDASVDLANYTQTGRYPLPVGTSGNQLGKEASGVTYNKKTGTLFIVGDEGTGVVEVTKQGVQVSAMSLGGADVEGIASLGNGEFVYVEERLRSLNRFTYVPNGAVGAVQSVVLGTTVGNIGIEGISYDPATKGFIAVKETGPLGVFQTTANFATGAASNGSPTTENSVNLFDPAKTGLPALNDVYALSNVLSSRDADYKQILIISAGAGKVVKMDRSGNLLGTLNIGPAQNEGLAVDDDLNIYTVNENGGGVDHPEMLVFSPTRDDKSVGVGSNLYLSFPVTAYAGTGDITISNGAGDTRTISINDATQVTIRDCTVIVNPKDDLRSGWKYSITYPAGLVKDARGNKVSAVTDTKTLSFKTAGVQDTTAPTLVQSTPADNASGVPADTSIELVFSENVKAGSGNIVLDNGAGDLRTIPVGNAQAVFSANTLRIVPAAPLLNRSAYSVRIDAGAIVDGSGNAFAGITSATALDFTVAAAGPTILNAGDLLFLGINADPVDAFAFVLLKPIAAGTVIGFSDRDYSATTGMPASGESAYIWTADADYAAGTIVTIQTDLTVPVADKGVITGKGGGVSTGAETVYAFQGSIAGVGPNAAGAITVDRFVAAINIGTAAGDIPPELTAAGAIISTGTIDNAKYNGSLDRSNLAVFAANVRNLANWVFDDTTGFPVTAGSLFP